MRFDIVCLFKLISIHEHTMIFYRIGVFKITSSIKNQGHCYPIGGMFHFSRSDVVYQVWIGMVNFLMDLYKLNLYRHSFIRTMFKPLRYFHEKPILISVFYLDLGLL